MSKLVEQLKEYEEINRNINGPTVEEWLKTIGR